MCIVQVLSSALADGAGDGPGLLAGAVLGIAGASAGAPDLGGDAVGGKAGAFVEGLVLLGARQNISPGFALVSTCWTCSALIWWHPEAPWLVGDDVAIGGALAADGAWTGADTPGEGRSGAAAGSGAGES